MKRVSSTDNVVKKLEEQVQLITKIISAYKTPTPEFDKLVPHEYFTLETKKFLLLKAMKKDNSKNPVLKPSKAVDDLWTKFMTCIEEYMMFCDSVLPADSVNRYIEKIGYDDERYPLDGFETTLKEYELRMNEKEMLETVLWNPRNKDKSYEEVLDITKNSNGEVFHSPFYEKGSSYTSGFRPPNSGGNIVMNDIRVGEEPGSGKRIRRNVGILLAEPEPEPKKAKGSSEKKRKKDDTYLRNEPCSVCSEAVGKNNHTNEVAVYLDSNNVEYKIKHRGQCKK